MSDQPRSLFSLASARNFFASIREVARSPDGPKAGRLFALLLLFLFTLNGLNVVASYIGRDFMTAVANRDLGDFFKQTLRYVAILAGCSAVAVLYRFIEERLGLLWRNFLTNRLVQLYLQRAFFHRLDRHRIGNPDQRIADDVKLFTASVISFLLLILNATISGIAFAGVMLSISPLLFGVAVTYATLGTAMTIWLGRPMIGINYAQSDREAELRADLVQLREHSELIALAHFESQFLERLRTRIRALVGNYRKLISVNRNLNLFTSAYNNYIQILPVLVVAPMYIRGEVEFGVITQASVAFAQLLGAFSLIVTQFQQISSFMATLQRLDDFSDAAREVQSAIPPIEVAEDGAHLRFVSLTLLAPDDGAVLVRELNYSVEPGKRLLVSGSSDEAKVALFRATAGLWDFGSGQIVRPAGRCMCFVPERPYLPPGTLREILASSDCATPPTIERVDEVVSALGLHEVMERIGGFDVERDWEDMLSLAELQRLVVARVLMIRPDFVMFDRIESTLDTECLHSLHVMLDDAKITYVTIGRGNSSLAHYDAVLELSGEGAWAIDPLVRTDSQSCDVPSVNAS